SVFSGWRALGFYSRVVRGGACAPRPARSSLCPPALRRRAPRRRAPRPPPPHARRGPVTSPARASPPLAVGAGGRARRPHARVAAVWAGRGELPPSLWLASTFGLLQEAFSVTPSGGRTARWLDHMLLQSFTKGGERV